MNAQATELVRCMQTTPCSARGLTSLVPGLHKLRVACVRDQDRTSLLAMAGHILDWVQHATAQVRAHACLEIADMLAEDLGHRETPARLYERALAWTPTDLNVTDRARRTLSSTELEQRVEWLFVLQARTLDRERPVVAPELRRAAWSRLGELRRSRGQLDAAIKAYDAAVEVEPCVDDVRTLAELLEQRDRPEDRHDAAELYVLIAGLSPETQQVAHLERALILNPSQTDARASMGALQSALHRTPLTPLAKQVASTAAREGFDAPALLAPGVPYYSQPVAISVQASPPASLSDLSSMARLSKGPPSRRARGLVMAAALVASGVLAWTFRVELVHYVRPSRHATVWASDQQTARPAPEPSDSARNVSAPSTLPLADSGSATSAVDADAVATASPLPITQSAAKPAVPKPRFVAHVKSVRGGRMRARALERTMAETSKTADACYADALGTLTPRPIEVRLTWLVSRTGKVSQVRAKDRGAPRATRCASRALQTAHFPRPKGGAAYMEGVLSIAAASGSCEIDGASAARNCALGP